MIKIVVPLSIIIALRFLGLFIVMPVLSIYALSLEGSTEILVGVTIGIYAISQMITQVPFGLMSDKIGRKKIIVFGTIIFVIGSIICAYADTIYGLMFGRVIQGAGAISAVATAMISDLIKEEIRTKAMAIMGAIIALSFALSMIAGPLIGGHYGVDKLFLITSVLGVLSLLLLIKIPNPPKIKYGVKPQKNYFFKIFTNPNLYRMNITNFLQKAFMTMTFISIPIVMNKSFGWSNSELWKLYFPAMLFGLFGMFLAVRLGGTRKKSKEMLVVGVILFAIAYIILGYAKSDFLFILGVTIFFLGFNIHEPLMQSLASKYAKANEMGLSLGIFNVFGYFGTFLGGVVGGFFLKYYSLTGLGLVVFFLCLFWLVLLITLRNPSFTKNFYVPVEKIDYPKTKHLNSLEGIVEWYINKDENLLVIKYDSKLIDDKTISNILKQ
ncbi:MAG: MFS transporter [Campylobacteraceae bacterium]|nr:MFS transporter [Campylobacteraceae bacterium]